nr:synaptobrevin, longin-like domain protein [Tanacetum cinerariifolium]
MIPTSDRFGPLQGSKTTDEGTKILATVDGKPRTISESSIRRNIKLNDEAGISSLPDEELFENFALMGYNILPNQKFSFQKGQFSHQWKYLIHTIMQCLSPKSTCFNEFSSNIATAVVCLATNRVYNFSKMIFDGMVRNVNNKVSKFLMYPRQYSRRARIAQSSALPTAADEPASPSGDDSQREASSILTSGVQVVSVLLAVEVATVCIPTGSGMVPSASPIFTTDSVVTHYARCKGKEKMVESDTPKKKKLQEQIDVQEAREMKEQLARKDLRRDEQIARDAEIARIHAEEELQMLINGLDRNNKTIAKYLQEYEQFAVDLSIRERIDMINELVKYQDHYAKVLKYQAQQRKPLSKKQQREFYMSVLKSYSGWKTNHFKGMSLEEIREKFIPVWKRIEDFVPMAFKEEGERFKRKRLRLEQSSVKKMKTVEDVSEEDLKQMMQLVPMEEVYVEAIQRIRQATSDKEKELWVELKRLYKPDVEGQLWTHTQALMHDPVEWRLYDTCGVHHVLSRDQEIFMLVKKDYLLRKGLALVMISNKIQVENYSQMASDLIQKIHKIVNSLRQRDD